jgi:hypothetical protein
MLWWLQRSKHRQGCSTASVSMGRKDYLQRHTSNKRMFLGLSNYLALYS